MKTVIQLTSIFFGAMITIACSSDSGSGATTASTTTQTCKTSAGVTTTCDETNAANSGGQVVADGSSTKNAAQVPATNVIQAHQVTVARVSDAQIAAKAAEVRAAAQRITNDPESGIDGGSSASPVSVSGGSISVSSSSSSVSSSPAELEIHRGPSSIPTEESAPATTPDSSSAGGNGNTVW